MIDPKEAPAGCRAVPWNAENGYCNKCVFYDRNHKPRCTQRDEPLCYMSDRRDGETVAFVKEEPAKPAFNPDDAPAGYRAVKKRVLLLLGLRFQRRLSVRRLTELCAK